MNIMGMVLPLIGNFILKNAKKTAAENLVVSRSLQPVLGLSPGLDKVAGLLKGNLGSLIQNPIGLVLGNLQGAVPGMLGQIAGMEGMGGLTQALGGLQTAMGTLSNVTNMMSGLGVPDVGQFGPSAILGHLDMLNSGFDLGAGTGLTEVLGPLRAGGFISACHGELAPMITAIAGGGGDVGAAINRITDMSAQMRNLVDVSTNALTTGQVRATQIAQAANSLMEVVQPSSPSAALFTNLVTPPGVVAAIRTEMGI